MTPVKLHVLLHGLMRIFLVIGITVSAIYFNNTRLLWWFIVPVFCGIETNDEHDKPKE